MSNVNWNTAPNDAEFYAGERFLKVIYGTLYFYYNHEWIKSGVSACYITQESDYEVRPTQPVSTTKPSTTWTATHYNNTYTLTKEDIQRGNIKIDPYLVSMAWKLGEKDNTGVLFHNLKTIARFGGKNNIEREIVALHNQTKRLAELHGVLLK
jgi:hypothetical protein